MVTGDLQITSRTENAKNMGPVLVTNIIEKLGKMILSEPCFEPVFKGLSISSNFLIWTFFDTKVIYF